jgi:hypothetical protein
LRQKTIVLAWRAIGGGDEISFQVAALLQTTEKRIDTAFAHERESELRQALDHLVAITGPLRNGGQQAHIQRALE